MIHRIFDNTEIPATCVWEVNGASHCMPVVKVSRLKAIVERPQSVELNDGVAYDVTLELPDKKTFTLQGTVSGGSEVHVFLRWNHFNEDAEGSFQDFLVANARDKVDPDEERGRRWVPPRKVAERQAQQDKAEEAKAAQAKKEKQAADRAQAKLEKAKRAAAEKAKRAKRAKGSTAPSADGESNTDKKIAARKLPAKSGAASQATPQRPDASQRTDDTKKTTPRAPATGVQADILARAQTIKSAELAARHDNVRVLSMGNITGLIQEAVDEVATRNEGRWDDEQRKRLLEEAEEAFQERLDAAQAEKAGLEEQIRNLDGQLTRAQGVLQEEQSRVVEANQFTVSDAGIQELETRLGRMVDRAAKAGSVSSEVEEEMRSVVARLLDDERHKMLEQEKQAQNDAIDLLERKVNRLAKTLEDATSARQKAERRANALEAAGGSGSLRNVYEAGLDDEDPDKEHKLGLLKEIIDVNRDVRKHLAKQGTKLGGRARPQGAVAPQGSSQNSEEAKEEVDMTPGSLAEPGETSADIVDSTEAGNEESVAVLAGLPSPDETLEEAPLSSAEESEDSGVKKIAIVRAAPPPLDRSKK